MKDFGQEIMAFEIDCRDGDICKEIIDYAKEDGTIRLDGYDGFLKKSDTIKKVVIIHHNDLDGYASAANVVQQAILENIEVELHPVNYNAKFNMKWFVPFNTTEVWILDYSFSNRYNLDLILGFPDSFKSHLVWIDHHGSSMTIDEPALWKLNGFVCDYHISSAVQVELYLQALYKLSRPEMEYSMIPPFLRYVSDWDTFSHAKRPNGKETVKFNYGIQTKWKTDFKEILNEKRFIAKHWKIALSYDVDIAYKQIQELVRAGDVIYDYAESVNARMQAMGIDMIFDFEGKSYTARVVNAYGNSLMFGDYYDNKDFCCVFRYDLINGTYSYTLFSKNLDSTKISKYFGGGGHPGASGFSLSINMFEHVSTSMDGTKHLDLSYIHNIERA